MTTQLAHVRPGDIITADQWNLVVDAVNQLLQSGPTAPAAGVTVAVTVPAGTTAEPIRVGGTLQILGQNFGFSLGVTTVAFVGPGGRTELSASNFLTGSSDTRLVLTVPSIPGVTTASTSISLVVSNGGQSATQTLFAQVPAAGLTGDIFVNWRSDISNPAPNPVNAGAVADFAFQLTAATNQRATIILAADIPTASAAIPSGLISALEFRDSTGNTLLTSKSLDLQAGEVRNLIVRMPQVPAAWGGVTFSLVLTAASGSLSGADNHSITVGVATAQNDPAITVQQTGVDFFNTISGNDEKDPTNASFDGSTIKLRQDRQAVIAFNVGVATAGTYALTVLPKANTTLNLWNPQLVQSPATIVSTQNNDGQSHLISIGVTPSSGATATGTIVFSIKRSGATLAWTKEFAVQLLS